MGRHHHITRAADVDRARWPGGVRAGSHPCTHKRRPRACQSARCKDGPPSQVDEFFRFAWIRTVSAIRRLRRARSVTRLRARCSRPGPRRPRGWLAPRHRAQGLQRDRHSTAPDVARPQASDRDARIGARASARSCCRRESGEVCNQAPRQITPRVVVALRGRRHDGLGPAGRRRFQDR